MNYQSYSKFKPLVRGIKYPLQFIDGNLATAEDEDIIVQQIISVIDTKFGERVLRPSYATDYLLFRPGSERLIIEAEIEKAIKDFVEEVAEVEVTLRHDNNNKWMMYIKWRDNERWYPIIEYSPDKFNVPESQVFEPPDLGDDND
ncbi:hypothetical protein [Kamptonema sp. UHCC 0994]|uniref:hypothetical protein n=1 Tax=Kamptonema sp. UHCC 0994 TaxID=3031329 RepID=UPI0023B95548|nr:hypothetical protein [Kamptonema sp. UHCC 0994]MDF0554910.1 hypothetical protein [Kamptonema sp. UHCC 0994]